MKDEKIKPSRSQRLWLAFVLGILCSIGPLSIDMYLPSFPVLATDLHSSTSLVQLSLTACLLGIALGQLLVGSLSDRYGRKRPLLLALLVYSIASIFCAFSPSIGVLIALRFVQGIAGAGGIVIARAIVRDLYEGTALTKFFSLLMLVNGAAPILAPVIGGQILRFTSWRGVFIVLCILSIGMILATLFGIPETLQKENRSLGGFKHTMRTYGSLLRDRVFMGYALAQGFVMAAMFAYIAGSPFVVQNIFNGSPQLFSIFFATNGIGIIIASQTAGRLAGRVSENRLLFVGLTLALAGSIGVCLAVFLGGGLFFIMACLFFVVSSVGIIGTTSFSLAMQNQQKSAGSAAALLGLLPFVLGATVAPLVGVAGSYTAVPMAVVIVICDSSALLVYLFLTKRDKEIIQAKQTKSL